jgi:2-keto-4-pentenoate hydratase
MTPEAREELAGLLLAARRDGHQLQDLPAHLVPADADEAYGVAFTVAERLGWEPLGWKVAGTNDEMRRRLRMPEPILGRSFRRFAEQAPAHFRRAELLDPLVEAEFFAILGRDLPPRATPYAESEVLDAVAAVHAGVELAECRFPNAALPPFSAILADGSGNGRYILGPAIPDWRQADLAGMAVAVSVNGQLRREGNGAAVMGQPLRPLTWLANRLIGLGSHLRAGEWVSTGTASGMLPVRAGDAVVVRFGAALELALDVA